MAPWMIGALALLRAVGIGAAVTGGAIVAEDLIGGGGETLGVNGFNPFNLFKEKKKRRRRRRALTASDRADIAFITGLLGAGAGKNFALTIATRAA